MARYIPLSLFTERGAREITQPRDRAHSFARATARSGIRIEVRDWTLGDYSNVRIGCAAREKQALLRRPEPAGSGASHDSTVRSFTEQGAVPLHKTDFEE
jgi:uncharacterized protein with GYD domain